MKIWSQFEVEVFTIVEIHVAYLTKANKVIIFLSSPKNDVTVHMSECMNLSGSGFKRIFRDWYWVLHFCQLHSPYIVPLVSLHCSIGHCLCSLFLPGKLAGLWAPSNPQLEEEERTKDVRRDIKRGASGSQCMQLQSSVYVCVWVCVCVC